MHLRRALLLFAIVLALAAIAASLSRPNEQNAQTPPTTRVPPSTERERTPTVEPGQVTPPAPLHEITFDASRDQTRRLDAGQAATVLVAVDDTGQVEIADLGISDAAEPLTPARFEILTSRGGRYPISFVSADGELQSDAGTLVIRPAEE